MAKVVTKVITYIEIVEVQDITTNNLRLCATGSS